jgi:hypothetical protein
MNFTDTVKSVDLVLAAGEVPLLVGETGIGKTTLATTMAQKNGWSLVVIDGNLLKEGEIGGLPTIDTYKKTAAKNISVEEKTTVYAIHHKLRQIDAELEQGHTVLLFIDEINRCEHAVQQELMNLILNREINGYALSDDVKIIAAMNPANNYDYQAVDMDAAQENRFVWLFMEPDYLQWLDWAAEAGIEEKVMEFISTFPEYLCQNNEEDISATPRSYERVSKLYAIYKENKAATPRSVFYNVIRGNVGKVIAEEFVNFVETERRPLIAYDDVFTTGPLDSSLARRIGDETHTRLYLAAKNILKQVEATIDDGQRSPEATIDRLIEFLHLYPVDLMIGIMKDIRNSNPTVYAYAMDNEHFTAAYFEAYSASR